MANIFAAVADVVARLRARNYSRGRATYYYELPNVGVCIRSIGRASARERARLLIWAAEAKQYNGKARISPHESERGFEERF